MGSDGSEDSKIDPDLDFHRHRLTLKLSRLKPVLLHRLHCLFVKAHGGLLILLAYILSHGTGNANVLGISGGIDCQGYDHHSLQLLATCFVGKFRVWSKNELRSSNAIAQMIFAGSIRVGFW